MLTGKGMKLIIGILLLITWVKGSPFPDNMYHTNDPRGIPDALEEKGYQVRAIGHPQTIRKALADLDPWGCDDEARTQIHTLADFGRVAVRGRTYTETYHPGGRYYPTAEAYDRACWCPILYYAVWESHGGRQRITSHELRGGHVAVETTEIRIKEQMYYLFFDKAITIKEHKTKPGGNAQFLNLTKVGPDNPANDNATQWLKVIDPPDTQVWLVYNSFLTMIEGYELRRWNDRLQSQRLTYSRTRRYINQEMSDAFAPQGMLMLQRIDAIMALKMIDYGVNSLYEKYQWVEWEVTAKNGQGISTLWKRMNRTEPCHISDDENWGIEYAAGTEKTRRACDVREFSLTINTTRNGFTWILPIGRFEPYNMREDHRYLIKRMNKTVEWVFRAPGGLENWFIKAKFWHGPPREKITKMWALMHSEATYTEYHKTLLAPLYWELRHTTVVKSERELMCDRDAYYIRQRELQLNERANAPAEEYQALRILAHLQPEKCEQKYYPEDECKKGVQLAWCKEATGPLEVVLKRRTVIPDIHNNRSVLAYGQPCFMHNNDTRNGTRTHRTKRFLFALLFSAIVEASISAKLENYQALMNQRLGALASRMNDGFNRIEGQLDGIHRGQMQMQHEITVLARFTEELANRENTFEKTQITIDRQLIEGEIALSRTTIENRQLALATGKASAQAAIIDYHLHKRIISLMEHLPTIKEIQNNTIYSNNLRRGIIECQELYWYGTNLSHFVAKYQDTEALEQVEQIVSNAPMLRWELEEAEASAQRTLPGRKELEEIENATLPAFDLIAFTIHWDPVTLDFNNLSWAGGAQKVLSGVKFRGKSSR